MKEQAKNFLEHETYCVISSTNPAGHSQSELVDFSESDSLDIMIGTSKQSRKFKIISLNPVVSLVFGFDGKQTLQYEGIARIPTAQELEKRLKKHFLKQPSSVKYENDPEQTYIIIEPSWLRITKSGPVVLGELRVNSR